MLGTSMGMPERIVCGIIPSFDGNRLTAYRLIHWFWKHLVSSFWKTSIWPNLAVYTVLSGASRLREDRFFLRVASKLYLEFYSFYFTFQRIFAQPSYFRISFSETHFLVLWTALLILRLITLWALLFSTSAPITSLIGSCALLVTKLLTASFVLYDSLFQETDSSKHKVFF